MRRPPAWFRQIGLVMAREWAGEWRRPEMVFSIAVYGLLLVVIFSLAVNPLAVDVRPVTAGLLWLGFFFAALSGFQRSFAREREEEGLLGLRASPLDPAALFYGKWLFGLLLLAAAETVVTPIFLSLVHYVGVVSPWGIAGSLALGSLGLTAVSALVAAIASGVRAGEALLPLLALPLLAPLAMGAVRLTDAALSGDVSQVGLWVRGLAAYDIIFLALPAALFQYIVEE